jgi:predicted CopG family antitoxin
MRRLHLYWVYMGDDTTIRVSGDVADELHSRKGRGESYDDVLRRLLWGDSREGRETPSEQSGVAPDAGIAEAPRADETASSASGSPPAHPRDSGGETQVEWVSYRLQAEGVEFPQGRDRTDCELAVSAAFAYLAGAGQATKGQIVLATMPENPLGYDMEAAREKIEAEGERFRGAWWRRVVKPGLEALPGVEKPSGGQSEWRYTGE